MSKHDNIIEKVKEQIREKELEIKEQKGRLDSNQKFLKMLTSELTTLQKKMFILKKKDKEVNIDMSDHAIVRYLERIGKLNRSEFVDGLLTDEIKQIILKMEGNGRYENENIEMIFKDYKVITIVSK